MAFPLEHELLDIGRRLNRWQAEIRTLIWSAVFGGALWLFALSDLAFRYARAGRYAVWALLVLVSAAGIWRIVRALRARWSAQAVAARIERAFPQLDNRLINCVQFAARSTPNPMEHRYIQRGVPEWRQVQVGALRDKRALIKALLAFALAAGVLTSTGLLTTGGSWTNALLRVLNPFSRRPPSTLAVIEEVHPGHTAVLKGDPLVLTCKATGKLGQEVWLDLWPADDKKSVMRLGKLGGEHTADFTYRLPKVAAALHYRFRAGDAVSERFAVETLPPLAFVKMEVTVTPPAYTKQEAHVFDGLSDTLPVPQGATLALAVQCNRALKGLLLSATNGEPRAATSDAEGLVWRGAATVLSAQPLTVSARDAHGVTADTALKMELLPDQPPTLRVIAPTAKTMLGAGAVPSIQFEAFDDFGVSAVRLEKMTPDPQHPEKFAEEGVPIREWTPDGVKEFATNWNGAGVTLAFGDTLAFRLVTTDNCAAGPPHRVASPLIQFGWSSASNLASQAGAATDKAAKGLGELLEWQRANLDRTLALAAAATNADVALWKQASQAQENIRKLAGQLIADPKKPLGVLTESARELYRTAMTEVIDALDRVPGVEPDKKTTLAQRAVLLETRILRVLSRMEAGVDQVKRNREISGLAALLDALIKGQETALDGAKACLNNPAALPSALVNKQDRLAQDLGTFVLTCRRDAETQSGSDKEFSQMLVKVADGCEQRHISANMLRAAERLSDKKPDQAVPLQTDALTALQEFQKLMHEWRVSETLDKTAALQSAIKAAGEKMEKIAKLEAKALEAIRETKRQEDKSGKQTDELEMELDEDMKALQQNVEEAMCQVATDLQIFPELPVANDLVEDCFQVYEEIKQKAGSEKNKEIEEWGLQKEDQLLEFIEKMQNVKERMDDMEIYLAEKPDNAKRETESFDQTEIPKIPIVPLPSEMEDIIGDLLEEQEELEEKSDDSATNQSTPDMPAGWDIMEGEYADYAAKGKSGNARPDHKEQDGRSGIGRQGQSDGESTAASGKINEGDENIEKRMTQDASQSGSVQEEGHAKAKATGGGKESGFGDELGMAGSGPRRDSKTDKGSPLGLQAMLKRNAQALYAKAELANVRTGSLDEAVRWMQQAEDALARGASNQQVREFQKRAIGALKKTQTELNADVMPEEMDMLHTAPPIDDQLAGARDEAPANYRDLVSEYFKALGSAP